MSEGWSTEKALEFYIQYLDHNGLGVPVSRHEERIEGKGTGEKSVRVHDYNVPMKAHFEILQQASVVSPYVDMDKKELLVACNILGRSKAWIQKQHKDDSATWLREKLMHTCPPLTVRIT